MKSGVRYQTTIAIQCFFMLVFPGGSIFVQKENLSYFEKAINYKLMNSSIKYNELVHSVQ